MTGNAACRSNSTPASVSSTHIAVRGLFKQARAGSVGALHTSTADDPVGDGRHRPSFFDFCSVPIPASSEPLWLGTMRACSVSNLPRHQRKRGQHVSEFVNREPTEPRRKRLHACEGDRIVPSRQQPGQRRFPVSKRRGTRALESADAPPWRWSRAWSRASAPEFTTKPSKRPQRKCWSAIGSAERRQKSV